MRFLLAIVFTLAISAAHADTRPHIVVDLTNDRVLSSKGAFHPWHPASLTKMMTAYTVLEMMRTGEVGPDTKVMMTWWAAQQSPSKMGFPPGTLIPLRDALAMIAVKSANDVSQAIAESLAGGKAEDFAARMNQLAGRLGMTGSYFVNPHGLHDDRQVTTARDMAILARALRRDFPDWMWLWSTPAIRTVDGGPVKPRTYRSFNALLARFEGADGMKTGYVCPSGWNFAGSATRDGRTLLAIVLGRNNATDRVIDAAKFLERAFEASIDTTGPTLAALVPSGEVPAAPPNLRAKVCTVKVGPKPGELRYLPEGVQGPPAPPREWLLPKPKLAELSVMSVATAGRAPHAPDIVGMDAVPVPETRPPDPPLDGTPVLRTPYPTIPAARPDLR